MDSRWRGLGVIPQSGVAMRAEYADRDMEHVLRLAPGEAMLLLDEICFNRLCHPVMRSLSYYTNFFDFSILRKLL